MANEFYCTCLFFGPRFPRIGLERLFFSELSCYPGERKALAGYLRKRRIESLRIGYLVIAALAIVKPKYLLIDIAEQMKRLYAYIGSIESAL